MMVLCLSGSRIYNKSLVQHFDPQPKKKKLGSCSISFLVNSGRSPSMTFLCLSASRIYNTFSISIRSRKKNQAVFSMSFLVRPGRSPGMMLLCLSASRIYNKSLVQHFALQTKKNIRQSFYILSGFFRQKSWQDVIMPERFQDI